MAADDLIYVNLYGEEVAPNDPAAQAKYAPGELKALRAGGFFPRPPGAVADAVDDDAPSPVLHSGIGQRDAADDEAADDARADGEAKKAAHAKK